tara:strand:+ start:2061 stop:2420 length:360 start_codon:yes stop_codon:yes gene_type:complete
MTMLDDAQDLGPLALKSNLVLGIDREHLADDAMRRRDERAAHRRLKRFAVDWIGEAMQNTRIVIADTSREAAVIVAGVDWAAVSLPKWSSNPTYSGAYLVNCYEIDGFSGRRMIVTEEA